MESLSGITIGLGLMVLILVFWLLRAKRKDVAGGRGKSASLDDELARLRRILLRDPRNEKALYQMGAILFQKNQYREVIEQMQLLERLQTKKKSPDFPYLYEMYRLLGLSCFRLNDYGKAMDYLVTLRQLEDPRVDWEVLCALGTLYFKAKNFPRALTLLSRAWEIDNRDARIGSYVGRSLAEIGRWRQAVEVIERVVDLLPKDYQIRWILARGYEQLNQPHKAIRYYQQLKRVDEMEERATLEESKLFLKMRKNTAQAAENLNTLLVAGNGALSCEAGYLLGQFYLEKNEVDKAIWYFQQVKDLDPDYGDVSDLLQRYGVLLGTPNLLLLLEGQWDYQRILARRLVRKYYHGKETLLKEDNSRTDIMVTVSVTGPQGEEPVLLVFHKGEQELGLEHIRSLQNQLQRKGQQIIVHTLGEIDPEALEYCNSRHIKLVQRDGFLQLLAAVGQVEIDD